ncbi:beta-galactosidase GalA [Tunturiibacter lichenicola]|uniref:beta-galactosidase GalA n=1 Tax=Tunturiibacter lichenicola TaxID=2051959 RepID=UPI003D9BD58C
MKDFSRRNLLKTGLIAPAVVATHALGPLGIVAAATSQPAEGSEVRFRTAGAAAWDQSAANPSKGVARERLLLDFGWRFHLGNANDPAKDFGFGTERIGNFQKTGNFLPEGSIAFDDGEWEAVNLPHDWAIELPFTDDPSLASKGFYPLGRKYPETSVGWYRRVFELPAEDAGKLLTLEFDGAYRETTVIFNNFYIGTHKGGYDPFSFDVTTFANPGGRNVLMVRVEATSSDGWFYEGAGIYRHLWLVKTSSVHVKQWGTFVSAKVSGESATLSIRTEIANRDKETRTVRAVASILDPEGKVVGRSRSDALSIAGFEERECAQQIVVKQPLLWSLEQRHLYRMVTELETDGATIDRYETRFGIRTIHFDAEKGFFLNGEPVKLKGTCNHQDHAGVGVAVPDAVQYYRVRRLQEMGCNALRTSHNPPTPEFLDACDELGMLVFDETRMMSSNDEGLRQLGDLVRRDRNQPSVFMWSMGNEEGMANNERGVLILSAMKALVQELDGTRPVSIAPTGAIGKGGLAVLDVIGYNYMDPQAEAYHREHPDRPVIGTETVSAVGTRGIYVTDKAKGFVSSYDPYTTTGRASAEGWWRFCNSRPWVSGGFVWTGFDYRGEPSPNGWPNISSQYGIIDTCGFAKDSFYYYQSWWTSKPVLHLFPHWNWPSYEGKKISVWVYSNLDKVELLVNGKSLGTKNVPRDGHVDWTAEYAAGAIEARGYKGEVVALTTKRETTGVATKLMVTADRQTLKADGEDVAMFAVEVHDAEGRVVPVTENDVMFKVAGAGRLIGTGNGDPTNQQPDKGSARKAFGGYCMGLVQTEKKAASITVEVSSPGLASAEVTVEAVAGELRPHVPVWERSVPEGQGITGLWRPAPGAPPPGMLAFLVGNNASVFTLLQKGNILTGQMEGGGGGFGDGGSSGGPVTDGKVDGDRVSFKSGNGTYVGTIKGDRMELQKTIDLGWLGDLLSKKTETGGERPAIGPAPNGSDPSIDVPPMTGPPVVPVVLLRSPR